jgi:hypothetical protein
VPTALTISSATRRSGRVAIRALVAVGLLLTLAAASPAIVEQPQASGEAVTLTPAVRRTADGTAPVLLSIGADAPGDITVRWSLSAVEHTADGRISPGAARAPGTAPSGSRLRPGETASFTVAVPVGAAPTLLVAEISGARAFDTPESAVATTLATLLLPGAPPDRVTATLARDGEGLTGEIRADRPTVVSIRLRGRDTTTYPDRLVTPDAPLIVAALPARWPVPSQLSVTDESGAVTAVDTGTGAAVALAATLVALTAAGLVTAVRRRRSAAREPA